MLERCITYFLTEPLRLVHFGRALLRVSGILFLAGVVGAMATTTISVVTGMAKTSRPTVELIDLVAGLPTWWVPESVIGYGFALFCGAAGVWAIRTGRTFQRVLRN